MPLFSGPVDRLPFAPPLERWRYERGRTVWRSGGTWFERSSPLWSELAGADVVAAADRPGGERTDGSDRDRYVFLGGRVYEVSDAVAAELVAAGYSTTAGSLPGSSDGVVESGGGFSTWVEGTPNGM